MTTTQIRFILVVEDEVGCHSLNQRTAAVTNTSFTTDDEQQQKRFDELIKLLFIQLHKIYVEYTLNPFSPLTGGGPIQSPKFHNKIVQRIQSYNNNNK